MTANTHQQDDSPHGKQRGGLALCLSGGGFRATLYHLGLLRRLNQLDLLRHVEAVSSVSGGSITAAHLAQTAGHWKPGRISDKKWDLVVRQPLLEFCRQDHRTRPLLSSMALFFIRGTAVKGLEKRYARHLTNMTLADLPGNIDFIFGATDINFSTHWYFRRKSSTNRRTGNFRAGYLKNWKDIPVARAVAASSCFPPLFYPLTLSTGPGDFVKPKSRPDNWADLVNNIKLTDGGIYDNLGLQPVWDNYRFLIVSDGGRPARFTHTRRSRLVLRYVDLLQDQVDNLRRRMLFERNAQSDLDLSTCYCGIQNGGVGHGYSSQVTKKIAAIRTDLNAFTAEECQILENHGYHIGDHYLRKYLLDKLTLAYADVDSLQRLRVPHPELMKAGAVKNALQYSSARWRPEMLR